MCLAQMLFFLEAFGFSRIYMIKLKTLVSTLKRVRRYGHHKNIIHGHTIRHLNRTKHITSAALLITYSQIVRDSSVLAKSRTSQDERLQNSFFKGK